MNNKIIKKAVVLGLAVISLFADLSAFPVRAASLNPFSTVITSSGKKDNQKLTYQLTINNATVTDGQIIIEYDSDILAVNKATSLNVFSLEDINQEYSDEQSQGISFAFVNDQPKSVEGAVLNIEFDVKKGTKAKETVIVTRIAGINNGDTEVIPETTIEDKANIGRPELSKPKLNGLYQSFASVHLNWNGDSNADGYVIYRSTAKDGKYKKIAKVGTFPNYLDFTAKNKTTYYYKIASYQKDGDKTTYSSYSNVLSIKVKKFWGFF